METVNGRKLGNLLKMADLDGIEYEVRVSTVQGLKGVYVFFEKAIAWGLDYIDCALIEELK